MSTTAVLATIESQKNKILAAVPTTFRASLTFESIRQAVGMACQADAKLAKADPRTIYVAVLEATRRGLDLASGEAFLVPFWNKDRRVHEVTLVVGYQGKVAMAYRSGKIARILAEVIHENDSYSFNLADGSLSHTYDLTKPRGRPLAAWCRVWVTTSNDPIQEIMRHDEFTEKIRKKSKSPAYRDFEDEMFKRSVLNRCLKKAPKSRDQMELLNNEAAFEARPDVTYEDPETGKTEGVYLTPDPADEAPALEEKLPEQPLEEAPKAKAPKAAAKKKPAAKKPPVDSDGQASLGGMP